MYAEVWPLSRIARSSPVGDGTATRHDGVLGRVERCEHFVQVYESDDVFIVTLADFIRGGLERGDAAIVIASEAHREGLEARLAASGIDVDSCIDEDRYIALDADQTLGRFMVNGCEKKLFQLFCAYPKIGFTEDPAESIARLCDLHSKVLAA